MAGDMTQATAVKDLGQQELEQTTGSSKNLLFKRVKKL